MSYTSVAATPVEPALHDEGRFLYLNAAEVPGSAIVRLLAQSFAREPMAAALGVSAADLAPFIERFMPECTTNGLSVVAVPEDEPETPAAALLVRDYKAPMPDGVLEDFPWFLPIGEALMKVGEEYEARYPGLQPGDAADLWLLGTDPRFARRGIAGRLFRLGVDLARESGFTRCVTECTGRFSQRAAERAGFAEVARLSYGTFHTVGGASFARVAPPHTHLAIYDRPLRP